MFNQTFLVLGPQLAVPLWVANFWNTIVVIIEEGDRWRAAEEQLLRRVRDARVYEDSSLLKEVP